MHQVRVFNLNEEHVKPMRHLDPENIDHLVSVSGMVIRTSNVIPDLKMGMCCLTALPRSFFPPFFCLLARV